MCLAVGLDPSTLKAMHDPDWNPTLSTLDKLVGLIPAEFEIPAHLQNVPRRARHRKRRRLLERRRRLLERRRRRT
jgi:hypothetical protein